MAKAWPESPTALSEQLAILLGQHPLIAPDDFNAALTREDADFYVASSSRAGTLYPMAWTPEGIAVHVGDGCEGEQFNGVTGCHHSREYTRREGMTQALVKAEGVLTPAPIEFTESQVDLIKRTIAKGANNDELGLFMATCRRTGLDPFMRQIYAVKRWDSREKREVMAIQVGIDGLRLIAERTGKYGGQDPIEWLDSDGVWSQVWTAKDEFPIAARCTVYRTDAPRGFPAVARWDSYAQTFGNPPKLGAMWEKMPDVMLGKCAESLALRRAFPAEMSGIAAMIDANYDPAIEQQEIAAASGDVIEGEVVQAEPLTDATKKAIGKVYQEALKDEYKAAFIAFRKDVLGKRWPHAIQFTTNDWAALSEDEGLAIREAIASWIDGQAVASAAPPHEHMPQYNADLTVMTCSECGEVLEGPDADEPEQAGLDIEVGR